MRDTGHDHHGTIPEVAATVRVNGRPERLQLDTRVTLLDALRDRLGLTGTKKGCDHGACGACTCWSTAATARPANAVFHATGRRIRSLPISIDRLL